MSMPSAPVAPTLPRRPGARLIDAAAVRMRFVPTARHLARRRLLINLTKSLLPALALALLASIALWPEFDRVKDQTHLSFRRISNEVDGARLIDARYRGVDEQGRPYTLT